MQMQLIDFTEQIVKPNLSRGEERTGEKIDRKEGIKGLQE